MKYINKTQIRAEVYENVIHLKKTYIKTKMSNCLNFQEIMIKVHPVEQIIERQTVSAFYEKNIVVAEKEFEIECVDP